MRCWDIKVWYLEVGQGWSADDRTKLEGASRRRGERHGLVVTGGIVLRKRCDGGTAGVEVVRCCWW